MLRRRSPTASVSLEHTPAITASSSRTSASVDGKGKRFQRHSWSRRSIKWSADDSSKNSRCNGRCAGPIFCCRQGRGSSTRIWTTYSAVGIQDSGRNHKRRSQSGRWLDPRLFGALPLVAPRRLEAADRQTPAARVQDHREAEGVLPSAKLRIVSGRFEVDAYDASCGPVELIGHATKSVQLANWHAALAKARRAGVRRGPGVRFVAPLRSWYVWNRGLIHSVIAPTCPAISKLQHYRN